MTMITTIARTARNSGQAKPTTDRSERIARGAAAPASV